MPKPTRYRLVITVTAEEVNANEHTVSSTMDFSATNSQDFRPLELGLTRWAQIVAERHVEKLSPPEGEGSRP